MGKEYKQLGIEERSIIAAGAGTGIKQAGNCPPA